MTQAPQPITPRLVDSLYTEAMLIADEARSYFEDAGRDDRDGLDPFERVGFSCESLKVTTRIMHVVAWLLTQRAVASGELQSAATRRPGRRLGKASESDLELLDRLPPSARALIQASRDLYGRVKRLDEDAREGVTDAPSPARALQNRLERAF